MTRNPAPQRLRARETAHRISVVRMSRVDERCRAVRSAKKESVSPTDVDHREVEQLFRGGSFDGERGRIRERARNLVARLVPQPDRP